MALSSLLLVLIILPSTLFAALDCSDFSHIKLLGTIGIQVEYRQVDCSSFEKRFTVIETGDLILSETIPISRDWFVEIEDSEVKVVEKRSRFYWGENRAQLFYEFIIDGYYLVAAKMRSFYRHKSLVYQLDKDQVEVTGYNFHRYEYRSGDIELESNAVSESHARLK
jgi:hypothetical protein